MYSQRGYGLGDLFRNLSRKVPILKPVVKEAKGIGEKVGLKLAENLITDLVSGKSSKASAKERGKQARDMAIQQSIQSIFHKGNGAFDGKDPPSESDLGFSEKTAEREPPKSKTGTKRKRSESKKQPPAKKPKQSKKRTQKGGFLWSNIPGTTKGGGKTQKGGWIFRPEFGTVKGRGKQSGGVQPPIHYPLGNYPQTGGIFNEWSNGPFTRLARYSKGAGKGKRTKSKRHPKTKRRKQSGGMPIWLRLLMGRGKGTQAGRGKKRTGKKRTVTKASLEDIFS